MNVDIIFMSCLVNTIQKDIMNGLWGSCPEGILPR